MLKVRLIKTDYYNNPTITVLSDYFEATQEELDLLKELYEVEVVLTKEVALQKALDSFQKKEEHRKKYEEAQKKTEAKRLITAATRKKKQLEKLKAELGE